MSKNTVELTKESGLCCSCGICKGVCPKSCIEFIKQDGMYYPVVDSNKCIKCGICYDVCPGLVHNYKYSDVIQAVKGDSICSYNAWSKNDKVRHVSASGGCISTLVVELLKTGAYDVSTTVDTYEYSDQVKSVFVHEQTALDKYSETTYPKSRYLPVSHEDIVSYVLKNKDKKVIFIGTSCAIRGFSNVIDRFNLNRENYLLVGLFCDKVFNYNIYDYFGTYADGKALTSLHFKNKDSGGWPGDLKLFLSDGTHKFLPLSERAKMKEYFMPERCLYCVDKLNVEADISLGDNYTEYSSSKKGSNSVIIRTQRGLDAWELAKQSITSDCVDICAIAKAQYINDRANNAYFAAIKQKVKCKNQKGLQINKGLKLTDNPAYYYRAYCDFIKKLSLGKKYNTNKKLLMSDINNKNKNTHIKRIGDIFRRIYHKVLRYVYLRHYFY